jgi:hypothetical protein
MVPPNHAFNRTRRYGAFYLAIVTGGGPVDLVPLDTLFPVKELFRRV